MREFEPPAFAPTPMCASARPKCGYAATGRRFLKGRLIQRILPACIRPTWCRRRSKAQGNGGELAAPVDRQGAALPDRAHKLRVPLCCDPSPYHERSDPRLHPHDCLHCAFHRADPTQQRAQCRDAADPEDDTTRCFISSPGTVRTNQASMSGVAQVQRAAMGRRRRPQFQRRARGRISISRIAAR